MLTPNELKKGTKVRLNDGLIGTLGDSKKGNTRLIMSEDDHGSVYAFKIVAANVDGKWETIVPTESMLELKWKLEASGWL